MELNSQINTFSGGMNLDTDISMIPDNTYRWAQNVRLLTDDSGTTGILQNIEDIRKYEGGLDASETILGTAVTRWYNSSKNLVEECGIVVTKETYQGKPINNIWVVTDFNSIAPNWKLTVSAKLNIEDNVAIVTNFETTNVNKIYLSDGLTQIKCINILKKYNADKTNPIQDSTYFDLLPNSVLAPFKFVTTISGSLPACMVQYCYLLFSVHGSETATSSLSNLIPIASDAGKDTKLFLGNAYEEKTNKGCELKATLFNNGQFDKIRIIRIQYLNSTDLPRVHVINELDLPKTSEKVINFSYSDTGGSYIDELSIDEFNDLIPFEFNAKSIAKMDNRLFASNLQEITWDIPYDARAYRSNKDGKVVLESSLGDSIVTNFDEILSPETDLIPASHDCINPMNKQLLYPDDTSLEYAYGYDDDGVIRGGRGVNVKYRFIITDLIESSNKVVIGSDGNSYLSYNLSSYAKSINVTEFNNSKQFRCPENGEVISAVNIELGSRVHNYSDPYFVSNFLGYQRDETYRFGIVFYNYKNIPSPVHWIGDIRFPSADIQGYEPFTFGDSYNGKSKYELISHPLGILFEVSNLPKEVAAYEIVRCNRTKSDRTVVTQGLLNKTVQFSGWGAVLLPNPEDDETNYDYQWSTGDKDIRPTMIPTYYKERITLFVEGKYDYEKNRYYQQGRSKLNFFDTSGIFDFVSADICFNKRSAEQILNKGMDVVPLYCASSVAKTVDNNITSMGIPFTKIFEEDSENIKYNSFGGPARDSVNDTHGSYMSNGIFDGLEDGGDIFSGGVCKYFQFFSKAYAANDANNVHRQSFTINDLTNTKNIPQSVQTVPEDFKHFIDYIDGKNYINLSVGAFHTYGPHGVNIAISVPDILRAYPGISNSPYGLHHVYNAVLICNIKNMVALYGGSTYMSRSYSNYISTGTYVKTDFSDYRKANTFGGDTYLGILDYTHTLLFTTNKFSDEIGSKRYVQCYIPCESTVNTYYRNDEHFINTANSNEAGTWDTGQANPYYLTEPGTLNTKFAQTKPMYTYNSAYSAESNSKIYISKSEYAEDNVKSANRIVCSEVKSINELVDSWTKFKFANYLDTDSTYGLITNLKVFKNKLYFFQDSAVGIASVNDRSLITDNNIGALTIGTGGILTRYDYLITQNGSSIVNDKSITNSETTLYWLDFDKNVLCSLGDGFNELSKVKQVLTYLNRLPDTVRTNAVSFYDKKYNEVWFKIYDRSLIFNEQLNAFTSFYTHNPNWFFPFSNRLVTIKKNNCYYLHNMYMVHDNVKKEERVSFVRFVVNKDIAYTKVFDNQWFSAEFDNEIGNDTPNSLTKITFETRTLETDPISYNDIEIREDTYRFAIGREKQTNPQLQLQTNMSYASRMRGKYLICNYTFDCNSNKEFKLPYVKTTYRYSMI